MAVEAVASVVLQKLTDMLTEESMTTNQMLVISELGKMRKAMKKERVRFLDVEGRAFSQESADNENDKEVKVWAKKYLGYLYSVEDTIESFALSIARQRKTLGFLMNSALILKNFTACKMLARRVKRIHAQIQKLSLERPADILPLEDGSITGSFSELDASARSAAGEHLGEEHYEEEEEHDATCDDASDADVIEERHRYSRFMHSNSYDEGELDNNIVGFKKHATDLLGKLTNKKGRSALRIVSLIGDPGSGKTTLARAVYCNRKIKSMFNKSGCQAWVTMTQDSSKSEIVQNLLRQVGGVKDLGGLTSEQALGRLQERLREKMFFIVLDEIQSECIWDCLKDVFPDSKNGSRILLTTCDQRVATYASCAGSMPGASHKLHRLEDGHSWDLFSQKVGCDAVQYCPSDLKQRVLGICKGLPLRIVLLGSLLSTRRVEYTDGFHNWDKILNSDGSPASGKWRTIDILTLCYNDLPPQLKLCLLYLVLFPKDYDIPVRRLQRLWLAEGFVKQPLQDETRGKKGNSEKKIFPEDVVERYFENFVQRSLIEVSKFRFDGSDKKCRLLGAIHEFLQYKAQDISLFHVHRSLDCHENDQDLGFHIRRLAEYVAGNKSCALYSSKCMCKHLRSYLSFNCQKKDTPAKEVGNLLTRLIGNGFGLLRVLDLEGVYKPTLPENLGNLFHLRYLGLRWTFLDWLPASVGDLRYLETLDVKHTYIYELPDSIWKSKCLRHLNLNNIRLDIPKHSLSSSLPQLMTLFGLSVDHESPVRNGLSRLRHLRELGITFCLDDSKDLLEWISNLDELQSLRLRSKDDDGCPSLLGWHSLCRLGDLSHLNLLGTLPMLPPLNEFPPNLTVLTLSYSQLTEDPFSILGQLPRLTFLRLMAHSYLGKKLVCPRKGFKKLEVLKLWMLKDLEELCWEDKGMTNLKELDIRCCDKLRGLPKELLNARTFRELILTNMPEMFKKKISASKPPHVVISTKAFPFE